MPLPGSAEVWPQEVRANGSPLAVVDHDGAPAVKLHGGTQRIEGAYRWSEIPQRIKVPREIGILALVLDGQPVEVAQAVRRAADVAVIASDEPHGLKVKVEMLSRPPRAGLFLEDQVWPKRCGHMAGKQVIATDEWLSKLRAAVHTAQGSGDPLYVTARTDARAAVVFLKITRHAFFQMDGFAHI